MPVSSNFTAQQRSGQVLTTFSNHLTVRSTLHFGIDVKHNLQGWWNGMRLVWRNYFNEEFHTFGLEWDEHGIWTWEHSRNFRVLNKKFKKFAIDRAPLQRDSNGAIIPPNNPWLSSNSKAAPFDQCTYQSRQTTIAKSTH